MAEKITKPTSNTRYSDPIQKVRKNNPFFPATQIPKLLTILCDKDRYIAQMSTLSQALNHGLVLEKVHRVIKFKQEAWSKKYINHNTKLRTDGKNEFEKELFKLMNNAVFGEMTENGREHRDIKLAVTEEPRKKLTSEPNLVTSTVFSENLEATEMRKASVLMNKPNAVGEAILDKSKELMYTFWYDLIKPMYGEKAQLCYMDTDSFVILIQTEDFFKILLIYLMNGLIPVNTIQMIIDHCLQV